MNDVFKNTMVLLCGANREGHAHLSLKEQPLIRCQKTVGAHPSLFEVEILQLQDSIPF